MSDQKLEALRQQLQATRRKHNIILALGQFGFWLSVVLTSFILFAFLVSIFKLQALPLQVAFAVWVCGIFAVTFASYWRFIVQLQNDHRFVHSVEERLPDLEQRLITSLEFSEEDLLDAGSAKGVSPQFVKQLWQDTKEFVVGAPLQNKQVNGSARVSLTCASIACLSLIALSMNSDNFLNAGRVNLAV